MEKFAYYAATLFESLLAVFGIRTFLEEPRYAVVERLDRGVEVRAYKERLAVETDATSQGDREAFGRLFRYITGANRTGGLIAMTGPVETGGKLIAMTAPVEQGANGTMRFFLPRKVMEAGAPEPTEVGVRLVRVPPERIAVLRFSGSVGPERRSEQERLLSDVLAAAGRTYAGTPAFMGYDPPFTLPFLRRNEVAVQLAAPWAST
ncbi:SOUL heme-binding protein [Methylorubrum populi]